MTTAGSFLSQFHALFNACLSSALLKLKDISNFRVCSKCKFLECCHVRSQNVCKNLSFEFLEDLRYALALLCSLIHIYEY